MVTPMLALSLSVAGNVVLVSALAFVAHRLVRERARGAARAAAAEALHNMSVDLASSLELRQVFDLVVRQAVDTAGADQAILLRVSPRGMLVAARMGAEDQALPFEGDVAVALGSPDPVLMEGGHALAARLNGGQDGGLVLWLRRPARTFGDAETSAIVTLLRVGDCAVRNAFHYEERHRQATFDGLTGLYNRREFDTRLAAAIEHSRRTATGFSLLLVDIDQFKAINDTHGHQVGDQTLRATAELVRASVRAEDVVARLGGDELAVIMRGADRPADAKETADRVLHAIRRASIPDLPGPQVTLSIGSATFPHEGSDAASLIKSADDALYQAKRRGRNRLVLAA
jgi:diguanylate cyclase (GGDEF)-like protein